MTPAPFHEDIADGPRGGRAVWITTGDAARLRLVFWPQGEKGRVLILPGRSEYAEKYGPVARALATHGYGAAIPDWRGQGLSDRLIADPRAGHIVHFSQYQNDLQATLDVVRELDGTPPTLMLAHSMGGAIGLRAMTSGLVMRAVAFSAPMWGIRISARALPMAWGLSTAASWLGRLGHRYIPGRGGPDNWLRAEIFNENTLTGDRERFDWMIAQLGAHPELGIGGATLGWLNAALRETAALRRLPSPAVPAYVALGSEERIVSDSAIRARVARWPGAVLEEYPSARHEIMMERPHLRDRFLGHVAALFDAHV
ncbi:alpha/beta fold hydrolase [Halodurantibacterium flavum]|uniref:Alpha/beta fold hydrolase n=1 Tax=Halodurantibacterium flavum TaxID=1382802 RepID=A0ABW4S4I4_9RHOB